MKRQNKKQKKEERCLGGTIKRPGCTGAGESVREGGGRVGGVSSLGWTRQERRMSGGGKPAFEPAKLERL